MTGFRLDAPVRVVEHAFVGGQWIPLASDRPSVEVSNSADGTVLATVAQGGPEQVEDAVAAARAVQPVLAATGVAERAAVLRALAAELDARRDDIARTIALEVGMPLRQSLAVQVGMPVRVLRSYADAVEATGTPERIGHSLLLRRPAGVVAAITPWNYPLHQAVAKLGAAIAAGCPLVLKPSNVAPLSAFELARAAEAAGVPAGAFAVVPGSGPVVGEALAAHPDIRALSFTGSTAAGARVAALAAANVVRVTLELGGKSASLLLDDADLDGAVKASVRNAFLNAGQTCSAWSRLIVPRRHLGEVVDRAVAEAGKLTVGHPLDPASRMGPLASQDQQRSVGEYVRLGRDAGLHLVHGGERLDGPGYFVPPTIFADVPADSRLAQEEIFGPVLCVIAVDDEDEAVEVANGTPYGLAGGVWSADQDRALAVAGRLRTGQVDVNGAPFNPAAPFGGFGLSGTGRELGRHGIEEFLETTSVQLPVTA